MKFFDIRILICPFRFWSLEYLLIDYGVITN
jgi:hypothetical protein